VVAVCVRGVADELGCDASELADRVLAVEFHGYRSKKWPALPVTLPSQWYGFQLVREAIARKAFVVILRGERDWKVAVPELGPRQ